MKRREKMRDYKKKLFRLITITLAIFAFTFIVYPGTQYKAEAATTTQAKSIPMSYNLQKYLYDLCVKRGLDYKTMLAIIRQESSFKAKAKGGKNYGYFQINRVNHASLAKTLKTKNSPYDPYVNINWGTYMMANLTNKYKKQGLKGTALQHAVLSAYNKGEAGYRKTGKAVAYINKHNKHLSYIRSLFA